MTACARAPPRHALDSNRQTDAKSCIPNDRRFAIRLPPCAAVRSSISALAQLLTMRGALASGNFVAKNGTFHSSVCRLSDKDARCPTSTGISCPRRCPGEQGTPKARPTTRRTMMSFAIQHVHVKTKDPKQTMQFYIDNLGATYVAEIPVRGHRLNLHGLTLNITTLISAQNHEQHYGIQHI